MSDLKTMLEQRAQRGVPIGSEQLRQRVALELAGSPRAVPTKPRGWAVALAAAAVVLVVVGGIAALFGGSEGSVPPANEGVPVAPTTTVVTSTTLAASAVDPTVFVIPEARTQGLPFEPGVHELCGWFSPQEIRQIIADVYAEVGVAWPIPATLDARTQSTVMWVPMPEGGSGCEWHGVGVGNEDFRFVAAPWLEDEMRGVEGAGGGMCHTLSGKVGGCERTFKAGDFGAMEVINDPGRYFEHLQYETEAWDQAWLNSQQIADLVGRELLDRMNWDYPRPSRTTTAAFATSEELCSLFTGNEILEIVTDAYEEEGATYPIPDEIRPVPGGFGDGVVCEWKVPGTRSGWGNDDFTVYVHDHSGNRFFEDGDGETPTGQTHLEDYQRSPWPDMSDFYGVSDLIPDGVVFLGGWSPGFDVYVERTHRILNFRHDLAKGASWDTADRDEIELSPEDFRVEVRILIAILDQMDWLLADDS